MEKFDFITQYLQSLPQGASLSWSSADFSSDEPWAAGWLNIYCPALQDAGAPPFFVSLPGNVNTDNHFAVEAGFDGQLEMLMSDDRDDSIPSQVFLSGPDGARLDLTAVKSAQLQSALDQEDIGFLHWVQQRWRDVQVLTPIVLEDDSIVEANAFEVWNELGRMIICPVWTPQAVSEALSHWALRHTGRSDLRFSWIPDAYAEDDFEEILAEEAADLGDDDIFLLAPGITITSETFDVLLAMDFDEASKATKKIIAHVQPEDREEEILLWRKALTDEGRQAHDDGELPPPPSQFGH